MEVNEQDTSQSICSKTATVIASELTPVTTDCNSTEPPTNSNASPITNKEKFQAEVIKWEEFYDQMHKSLLNHGTAQPKNTYTPKSASNFSMGEDGCLYYSKPHKNGMLLSLKVIRDYAERVRICKDLHLDTGIPSLHNRRDRMLELLGLAYYWKGQRRDVCQCIAACEMCSAGLGAKRKAKPPSQKRDIPRNGPAEPPKKRGRVGRHRRVSITPSEDKEAGNSSMLDSPQSNVLLGTDLSTVNTTLTQELAIASAINQMVGNICQSGDKQSSLPNNFQTATQFTSTPLSNSMEQDISFHQIFTIEDETSNQNSPPMMEEESLGNKEKVSEVQEIANKEVSIYDLLFKLPSTPSTISPSVIEAVHMAMKQTPDETNLFEASEAIMKQILSLGMNYNVIISPSTASAYAIAVFASMLKVDPLSVSSQISSRLSSPLAVIHDSCCAQVSNSELGPLKSCTALTGSYNWNLGDMTYPMDKDMLRMAVLSNRVAAVFYQPYAYIEKSQHITLEALSSVCHSRGSDVTIVVDASIMPTHYINLKKLVAEVKGFFDQGADLVLMPSVEKLHGQSHSAVLVGVSRLLNKVWRSIALLQKQVCLPLLCLPHDLVGTVVAYKALQDMN